MAFWSWSTLQFTLVLTAAKARKTRGIAGYDLEDTLSGSQIQVSASEKEKTEEKVEKERGIMQSQ